MPMVYRHMVGHAPSTNTLSPCGGRFSMLRGGHCTGPFLACQKRTTLDSVWVVLFWNTTVYASPPPGAGAVVDSMGLGLPVLSSGTSTEKRLDWPGPFPKAFLASASSVR